MLYQYHHTDALLASSTQGTNKLDADSIYRIGSISKLFTMYMMLIQELVPNKHRPYAMSAIAFAVFPTLGGGPAIARALLDAGLGWR